jgi:hypothetical protein
VRLANVITLPDHRGHGRDTILATLCLGPDRLLPTVST